MIPADLQRVLDGNATFTEAREAAGLSLGQASKLSGLNLSRLTAIEAGAELTTQEWAILLTLYHVTDFATPRPVGSALPVWQCCECLALTVTAWRHTAKCSQSGFA